ncbi:uncharacterized protein BDZ99DRAFT_462396 [Mytilinidion resinicola]|uniref:Uncharacterized protein n=1 Tax=Mytilinidion resinicola TaxID=574789 RepID=A0A6A6YSW0_9PEZI|nr:uncharacterized protein BDZ99DRAFT_462396 [Mytilinidion resinicola]KAF2811124.1 hypothetical protein BDZ99DRAFT_462396 [Mytilinidion resinicola]
MRYYYVLTPKRWIMEDGDTFTLESLTLRREEKQARGDREERARWEAEQQLMGDRERRAREETERKEKEAVKARELEQQRAREQQRQLEHENELRRQREIIEQQEEANKALAKRAAGVRTLTNSVAGLDTALTGQNSVPGVLEQAINTAQNGGGTSTFEVKWQTPGKAPVEMSLKVGPARNGNGAGTAEIEDAGDSIEEIEDEGDSDEEIE